MAEKSPETWLQSELSELLVNIHDALDAWSRLPFDCSWTRNPPASHYLMMLKGMEEQLLRMWVRMQRNQWGILEVEVLGKELPKGYCLPKIVLHCPSALFCHLPM